MKTPFIVITVLLVLISGFFIFKQKSTQYVTPTKSTTSPSAIVQPVDITASFTIKTDSVTRSFKTEKYHNQSPFVYITSDDPTKVHVKKEGITWNDFFKTLPMELTKDCLITGDGETLCDGKNGTLMFYLQSNEGSPHLNGVEDKDLLDKEVKQGDSILIRFTSS